MIIPIVVTPEQSFPSRNSTRKVGCCDIIVVERSFNGVSQNLTFQAETYRITTKPEGRFNCVGKKSGAEAST
jgi:hypothetical protein